MVAQLSLLHLGEVISQFLFGRESGAVDALELRVGLVTAVVGTGDGQEFESLQLRRVANVGAGAEIRELTVGVEGNFLIRGNIREAAEFVTFLAAGFDDLNRFLAGNFFAVEALILLSDFFISASILMRSSAVNLCSKSMS